MQEIFNIKYKYPNIKIVAFFYLMSYKQHKTCKINIVITYIPNAIKEMKNNN